MTDIYGVDVTATQDTPLGCYKEDTCLSFGCDAYLQKPLEYLPLGKDKLDLVISYQNMYLLTVLFNKFLTIFLRGEIFK